MRIGLNADQSSCQMQTQLKGMEVNTTSYNNVHVHTCIYSTCQMQGIMRFACQTCLPQTLNVFSGGAKCVYSKRKTHFLEALNAFTTNAKRVCSIEMRKVPRARR